MLSRKIFKAIVIDSPIIPLIEYMGEGIANLWLLKQGPRTMLECQKIKSYRIQDYVNKKFSYLKGLAQVLRLILK